MTLAEAKEVSAPALIVRTGGDLVERREATFSACEKYRYLLRIVWNPELPLCQFIGLNPSTATEMQDDPTIRRCKDFARRWGCGGLLMTNIFAFRATDPRDMKASKSPTGNGIESVNDNFLVDAGKQSQISVAAWGIDGAFLERGWFVKVLMKDSGIKLQCFKLCKNGEPYHPLYMAANTPLQPLQ